MNVRPDIHPPGFAVPADATRRLWSWTDLRRLEDAGILAPGERVELIAGEIIAMSPKGVRHEILRNELILYWADRRPRDVKFAEEPPLTLAEHTEPEPDIILFPASLRVNEVRADNVLLVVEIADSSLAWDLRTKAQVYAAFGVREYWVIDAATHETTVHRDPHDGAYRSVSVHGSGERLVPSLVPALAVSIADLGL